MLILEHVDAGYGDTPVLRDVTLVVPPASVVALIGANGAGKTTLLRVASGLLRPGRGAVRSGERQLTGQPAEHFVRAGIHLVPEGRAVFPSLTVAENLRVFAAPGCESESLERAFAAFPRLAQRRQQLAGTMSGGEQQMLALVRAYIRQADVVLLDEVSMGLAPKIVGEIFEFIQRLADANVALLVVEQYVTKILPIADYVYVLHRGRIAFAGEPAELEGDDVFAQYMGAAPAGAGR